MRILDRTRFFSVFVVLIVVGYLAVQSTLAGPPADSAQIVGPTTPTPTAGTGKRTGPFALILVVDAARFDEFDLTRMPNLAALAAHGSAFSRAWVGQLPSITETSHVTIATGVLPRRHLVLGDTWRVPGTSQMAPNLLDGNLVHTGYLGKFVGATHVQTLAAMVRAKYPGSLVATMSGHKAYAADGLGAGVADFVAYGYKDSRGHYVPGGIPGHVPAPAILTSPQLDMQTYPRVPGVEDDWTTTLALKFLFKYHPRVMMINLPEVDTFGHLGGTDGTVMQPLMQSVDRQIGRIVAAYQRAGMYDKTDFVVTSDHGMIPGLKTVQAETIDSTIKSAGGDPLYVGHGDYSQIWLKNTQKTPVVAAALAAATIPNVAAVYARRPKGGYTLLSPLGRLAYPVVQQSYTHLLSTLDCAEAPDIVLLYDENTMTMKPSYLQVGRKGDHGGATWGAQHIGLFLSGPGVRPAYLSDYPARLVDIAPTIETLMGIRPSRQDGVPLADALVSPPPWATAAQRRAAPTMQADVSALIQEAALRPNLK